MCRHSGYPSVGLFYLLAVIGLSLRVGRGPIFAAGVVSAVAWDFLFIPPVFTFVIGQLQDRLMFGTYFVVALITGHLTSRIRAQERNERMREDRATALFHLTQAISSARTLDDAVFAALRQADAYFGAKSALLLDDGNGSALMPHFAGSFTVTDKERGVADWAWRNRKKAGRFTDTLPSAEGFHVPLLREDTAVGVLILRLPPEATLTLAQRDLAESFATQLAQLVEREQLRAAGEREKLLAESDKLHRTLLDGVSHELKTPLAVLSAAVENLAAADEATRASLAARDPHRHAPAQPPRQQPPRPDAPRIRARSGRASTGATGTTWSTPRSTGVSDSLDGPPVRDRHPEGPAALPRRRRPDGAGDRQPAPQLGAAHARRARPSSSPPASTTPRRGCSSRWPTGGPACRRRCASASSRNSSAATRRRRAALGSGFRSSGAS